MFAPLLHALRICEEERWLCDEKRELPNVRRFRGRITKAILEAAIDLGAGRIAIPTAGYGNPLASPRVCATELISRLLCSVAKRSARQSCTRNNYAYGPLIAEAASASFTPLASASPFLVILSLSFVRWRGESPRRDTDWMRKPERTSARMPP